MQCESDNITAHDAEGEQQCSLNKWQILARGQKRRPTEVLTTALDCCVLITSHYGSTPLLQREITERNDSDPLINTRTHKHVSTVRRTRRYSAKLLLTNSAGLAGWRVIYCCTAADMELWL